MTTGEIALFSTCIGASVGIITQFLGNALKDKSEKRKIKVDLIAEERRLTYMILLNQVNFVQSGITIEYYHQAAIIEQKDNKEVASLEMHIQEIVYSNNLHAEYCSLLGDYCKNIYKIIHHVRNTPKLENLMHKIINESHEDFTGIFKDFENYVDLFHSYHNEHQSASLKIERYKSYFDEIRHVIAIAAKK